MSIQRSCGNLREMQARIHSWPHKLVSSCDCWFTRLRRGTEATGVFCISLHDMGCHRDNFKLTLTGQGMQYLELLLQFHTKILLQAFWDIGRLSEMKGQWIQVIMQLALMMIFGFFNYHTLVNHSKIQWKIIKHYLANSVGNISREIGGICYINGAKTWIVCICRKWNKVSVLQDYMDRTIIPLGIKKK